MKTKQEIVTNWLPRYTDTPLDAFGKYILLTNFLTYLEAFADQENAEIRGRSRPMQTATSSDGLTIINFGIGSPNAATICDLLSAVRAQGSPLSRQMRRAETKGPGRRLHPANRAIPPKAPPTVTNPQRSPRAALLPTPEGRLPHDCGQRDRTISTGTISHHQSPRFGNTTRSSRPISTKTRCIGIDMETATFFIAAFANKIPHGALLLVSDTPMTPEGVKTDASDTAVTRQYAHLHLKIGIESLRELRNSGESVNHLVF